MVVRPTTTKWAAVLVPTVFPAVTPIFVWIAYSAFVVAVDNLRLCRFIWLVFHGKTLQNTARCARLQTAEGMRPRVPLVFLVFFSRNCDKTRTTILGDAA